MTIGTSPRAVSTATALCALSLAGLVLPGCGTTSPDYGIDSSTGAVRTEIPPQFTAQAHAFSWGNKFVLKDERGEFGRIEERVFSWTRTFEYFDATNTLKATAKQRALSWGSKVDVVDENGQALGSIEENVFKSLFKVTTSYAIKDPSGTQIGVSDKVDWMGTEFSIKDSSSREIAKITRPFFDWGAATWDCSIDPSPSVDKRLMIFIPAFKTAADNARR